MSAKTKVATNGTAHTNGSTNGAPLTKAEALALALRATPFPVPEWGRSILLRPLTPATYLAVEKLKLDGLAASLEMVRCSWVDEDGKPMFDDIEPLASMDLRAIGRIQKHLIATAGSAIADEGAEKK